MMRLSPRRSLTPSLKTYVFSLKLYNALLYYRKTSRVGPGDSRQDAEAVVRPPEFFHCGNGQGVKPQVASKYCIPFVCAES